MYDQSSPSRDAEQRGWLRYPLDLAARVALPNMLFRDAKILDFSAEGMRLAVRDPREPLNARRGTPLHTGFKLNGRAIQARMSLMRVRRVGQHIELGTHFSVVNPGVFQLLLSAADARGAPRIVNREPALEQVLWRLRERLRLWAGWSARTGEVQRSHFLLLARLQADWEHLLRIARAATGEPVNRETLTAQASHLLDGVDDDARTLLCDIVDEILQDDESGHRDDLPVPRLAG